MLLAFVLAIVVKASPAHFVFNEINQNIIKIV